MIDERRQRGDSAAGLILVILILAVVGAVYLHPEWVHTKSQPPIQATARNSLVGIGRVLQLLNQGTIPLNNVNVVARNDATNGRASYHFDRIDAGQGVELGWAEWGWSVDPGETYTISADRYDIPIVFSSAQLGVN